MKKIAVIPARFAATRFPGKLMQMMGNKTVIATTYIATIETGLFNDVIVATDCDAIRGEIERLGGKVIMTRTDHESGSDRIAEAVALLDVDVIVNVQGDTPFVQRDALKKLLHLFDDRTVQVASLMDVITDKTSLHDPNVVKVCVDKNMNSLLFSRSVIPYPRNTAGNITHYRHIGIYGFRKEALLQFTLWPVTPLEDAEKIEC
ncbi:MAG TPA: 3-deoxy-manno-octulosonate cytidylyltransferase, partial [Flavisolibacter sp.]|nr:3-deoxy-manno-octulosonate cytidylyltransferase [Flavisolibacter sp.]